jgi:hypothetical protein
MYRRKARWPVGSKAAGSPMNKEKRKCVEDQMDGGTHVIHMLECVRYEPGQVCWWKRECTRKTFGRNKLARFE